MSDETKRCLGCQRSMRVTPVGYYCIKCGETAEKDTRTPARYTPDNLGRYGVREHRKGLRSQVGTSVLAAVGATVGDTVVYRVSDDGRVVVEVADADE